MSDETKVCPFCGKEIKASDIKCEYCGKLLIENYSEPNNKCAIKISIIVGFCLILFLILLQYLNNQKDIYVGEYSGERYEMNIKKIGKKYIASGQGSNSAFDGSDWKYDCKYVKDDKYGYLDCKKEITSYYFCQGEEFDSSEDFYAECKATYPKKNEKVTRKTYSNGKLILTHGNLNSVFSYPLEEGTYVKDLILTEYDSSSKEPVAQYAKNIK